MKQTRYVSVHGGHSGEFCTHARDRLEEIIRHYMALSFEWVGITEHIPPPTDDLRYPDEKELGLTASRLQERFDRYITTCRRLQDRFKDRIRILVGFETESWNESVPWIRRLLRIYHPDYIVGSVHHVNNRCIDFSEKGYLEAAEAAGGLDALYSQYFDIQYRQIWELSPGVIGHFDLVRLFDPDYRNRLETPAVWQRILRNLALIRSRNLILDFNTRALKKGASEPYVSACILKQAIEMGIRVVPGDDSHGTGDIGRYSDQAFRILEAAGADMDWQPPTMCEKKQRSNDGLQAPRRRDGKGMMELSCGIAGSVEPDGGRPMAPVPAPISSSKGTPI